MTLRTFKSTLGLVGLQWRLLVANVQTLEEAVQVGSEYLQIGTQATSRQESRVLHSVIQMIRKLSGSSRLILMQVNKC